VWGEASAPKVTLVGKGVCFDSGGLDLKTASGMLNMKKDMAGAAIMLSLAQAIMAAKLPVRLRVLLPMVEDCVRAVDLSAGRITVAPGFSGAAS
jgi:leucyl aminopeptidase